MPQGTVKEYDGRTHAGVLLTDERTEVFFDMASLEGAGLRFLRLGQRVRFDLVEEHGRPTARNLRHIAID